MSIREMYGVGGTRDKPEVPGDYRGEVQVSGGGQDEQTRVSST